MHRPVEPARLLVSSGIRYAKKPAVIAVARKLSVLLPKSWVSGEVYEPCATTVLAQARWRTAELESFEQNGRVPVTAASDKAISLP